MNLFESLVTDTNWKKLTKVNGNWHRDPTFCNYHKLGNKQKGTLGEYFVERMMKERGHDVVPPTHTDHDKIVDGIKTEIKFSLAVSEGDKIVKDKFIINHVAMTKDWDRLLFCGINPAMEWGNMKVRKNDDMPHQRMRAYFIEKEDFVQYMNSSGNKLFKHQQSGEKGGNDDYICTNFLELVNLPFVKPIQEW